MLWGVDAVLCISELYPRREETHAVLREMGNIFTSLTPVDLG
uniref:Uncharacterized protein n=1 Tax=Anguilla anguilla TaxID=7936 RepID=A0A0E9SV40_ANGAN